MGDASGHRAGLSSPTTHLSDQRLKLALALPYHTEVWSARCEEFSGSAFGDLRPAEYGGWSIAP